MLRVVCLSAVVAFATARRGSSEDKAWPDEAWKFDGNKITVKLTQVAEDKKPTTAPSAQWQPTSNSKVRGAKSYAMLTAGGPKNTFLVFTEKEMKGNEMPTGQDKIAVFSYTQEDKKASLEREGSSDKAVEAQKDFTFTLSNVQSLDADKNAAKSLEREEMGLLPFSLPFVAANVFLGTAATFGFAPFPWAYSSSSLSASLEKLGADLEVMDVPVHGLEREKFVPFAPFFMGPAFAAFGATAAMAAPGVAMAAPFLWGTPFGFM